MRFKHCLISALLLAGSMLISAEVTVQGKYRQIKMKNSKTGDVYNYYVVKPGEKLQFVSQSADSISLITKVGTQKNDTAYTYRLEYDKNVKNISKKIKRSTAFKALNGTVLSSYNKQSLKIPAEKNSGWKFAFVNTAKQEIFLKALGFNHGKKNSSIKKSAEIAYMPDSYQDEVELKSAKGVSSYFSTSQTTPVQMTLEGPMTLKIISRMVFENNLDTKADYGYKIFNNGKLLAEIRPKSSKSAESVLAKQENVAVSKGFTHQLQLPAGINQLRVENSNSNRKILYRFYINKSSLRGMNP